MPGTTPHRWQFSRSGGFDQARLETAADLADLENLDLKLWAALACLVKGLEFDERTLALIDADHDGRVRAPEVINAVQWCEDHLKDLAALKAGSDSVPLAAISDRTDSGKAILASAKQILKDLGKADAAAISLGDVADTAKIFAQTRFNGDGIVPADSAEDPEEKQAVEDVLATVGSAVDRSGKPGVDTALVAEFFGQAAALVAWDDEGRSDGVRGLGSDTEPAATSFGTVADKIEDWFTRSRLAVFDPRGATLLGPSETDLAALSARVLGPSHEEIEKLPLAAVTAGGALPLTRGLNPAWERRIGDFVENVVRPILGARTTLEEDDWRELRRILDPYRLWLARKPAGSVAALSMERLRELVSGSTRSGIERLIAEDAALEAEYAKIASVEQAVRYRRELARLLRNLVSFADFYGGRGASFQAGTLYLDARSCYLVIYVADAAKHAALAGLSSAFLAYCDITRIGSDGTAEKKAIVAAFTSGDTDNLMVGRNGVFYDKKGRDWDATVTSVIQNPVSIRQAFWTPYKRVVRLVEEQIAKRAAEKEKASETRLEAAAVQVANEPAAAPAAAPPAPKPPGAPGAAPKKVDVGMVAALGVAVAGMATFLSTVFATFLGLGIWMPLGILALVLAISGPSMLIAWLKLRRRNLGPILDANGWAVNKSAAINIPFGTSLTALAVLPKGASRSLDDPFAERRTPWKLYLALFTIVMLTALWAAGKLDRVLPHRAKAKTVLHAE